MVEYNLTAEWKSGLSFETEIMGHELIMDSAAKDHVSAGPSPKRMALAAVMGCTGMDVSSLMEKMRVPFTSFRIQGKTELTEEHPKVFKYVHLKYIVEGEGIKREKVEKAINLSMERYCAVSIMMKKHCPVTWELEVKEVVADPV